MNAQNYPQKILCSSPIFFWEYLFKHITCGQSKQNEVPRVFYQTKLLIILTILTSKLKENIYTERKIHTHTHPTNFLKMQFFIDIRIQFAILFPTKKIHVRPLHLIDSYFRMSGHLILYIAVYSIHFKIFWLFI